MINSLGVYMNVHFKEIIRFQKGKGVKIRDLNIFIKMEIQEIIEIFLKK